MTAYRVKVTTEIKDPNAPDAIKFYDLIALLTSLEGLIGVMNACLPLLRPVLQNVKSKLPKISMDYVRTLASTRGFNDFRITHMFDFTTPSRSGNFDGEDPKGWWEQIDNVISNRDQSANVDNVAQGTSSREIRGP